MKKTWFLAVLAVFFGTNAFGDCKVTVCSPGGDSDESILSTTGVVGNNATGQCYRCNWGDNDYECGEGSIIAIKHPDYAFNKQIKSFFYCSDAGSHNDTWVNHNPSETCKDSPMPSSAQNTEKYFAIDGNKTGAIKSTAGDSLVLANGVHGCVMYKCKEGFVKDATGTKCVAGTSEPAPTPQPEQLTPAPVQPAPQPRKTCREQRTTLNGKACCDTLSLGVYKKATDTCECKNGMTFVIENGTGYCRPSNVTPGTKYDCDATFLAQIAGWKVACAKNSDIVELINQIEEFCKGDNKTEAVFMAFYNTLLGYNPQQCDKTSENMTAQINDVNNAYSQLTAIHNKFRDNVSVWKDAEGNFNTARLASDTVAGVVLGTTGALVTSHVVKKNQVENGFEDIKCTIGGQNVAGWGDQFRVGIQ